MVRYRTVEERHVKNTTEIDENISDVGVEMN